MTNARMRRLAPIGGSAVLGGGVGGGVVSWNGQLHGIWSHLGLAGLGVLIGLIGALAGLVTILVGMYQLSQLDQRLARNLAESEEKTIEAITEYGRTQEDRETQLQATIEDRFEQNQQRFNEQFVALAADITRRADVVEAHLGKAERVLAAQGTWLEGQTATITESLTADVRHLQQQVVKALSLSSMVTFTPDPEVAVSYAEQALALFPELPYLRETLGERFARTTILWHWSQLVPANFLYETPTFTPFQDYRLRATTWLTDAVNTATRDHGQVPLEAPSQTYLRLAQMYTLDGQWTRSEPFWQAYLRERENTVPGPSDWAILAWQAPSLEAVRQRLHQVGDGPVAVDDAPFGPPDGSSFLFVLGLRNPAPSHAHGPFFPVVFRLVPGQSSGEWFLGELPREKGWNIPLSVDALHQALTDRFAMILTVWTPPIAAVAEDTHRPPYGIEEG